MVLPQKPSPTTYMTDELDLPFWEGAKQHKFLIQRCPTDGECYWPASVCHSCGSDDLEWVEAVGRGIVYTFTVYHRPFLREWQKDLPYNVAVIELEEGPITFGNVVSIRNEDIQIGMPVEVVFEQEGDATLPRWRPVEQNRRRSAKGR